MPNACDESVAIRDASPDDFGAILRLNKEWVHFTSPLDAEGLRRVHEQAAYHVVAESDGRVVAFLLALREGTAYESLNYRWFEDRGGAFLYIDRVIVDAAAHGAGIATALYAGLFAFAIAHDAGRVCCEIDVEPPNEASHRFHEKLGFHAVGTQLVADGAKRVSMLVKDL